MVKKFTQDETSHIDLIQHEDNNLEVKLSNSEYNFPLICSPSSDNITLYTRKSWASLYFATKLRLINLLILRVKVLLSNPRLVANSDMDTP